MQVQDTSIRLDKKEYTHILFKCWKHKKWKNCEKMAAENKRHHMFAMADVQSVRLCPNISIHHLFFINKDCKSIILQFIIFSFIPMHKLLVGWSRRWFVLISIYYLKKTLFVDLTNNNYIWWFWITKHKCVPSEWDFRFCKRK